MTLPKVDLASLQRVLIIKLSALGDIIHALPVSAALKDAYPHLELTWVVEEALAPLLTGNPCLNAVVTLPKPHSRHLRSMRFYRDYFRRLGKIRRCDFDLALDLQGLTKSAFVAVGSGADVRIGYHWLREVAALVERPVPRRPESVHIVEQYLDVARSLGAEPQTVRFPFHIPEEDDTAVTAMLQAENLDANAPFVAINPASARVLKEWGPDRFAALSDRLRSDADLPAVLVTADRAVASKVKAQVCQPLVDLSGRTTLKQLAAVLRRAAVHVCGDTGSGHLAAALGRPVVSLIGPTDPERACPYGQRANAISHRDVCGAACTWHRCQYERPHCLAAITVDEVAQKVKSLV